MNKPTQLATIAIAALILAAILALTLGPSSGQANDGHSLPSRLIQVWVPLPNECPPNYLRYNDYWCWDVFRPTPAPYPTPTGTIFYFPTLTPTPATETP